MLVLYRGSELMQESFHKDRMLLSCGARNYYELIIFTQYLLILSVIDR